MSINTRKLTPNDRAELKRFAEFLRAVGPPLCQDRSRLKAWVESDPEANCEFLGVPREQMREWGYEV